MPRQFKDIREALPIEGRRVALVTSSDWDEICERYPNPDDRVSEIFIHFDDGTTLTFEVTAERGFWYDGLND